MVKKIKSVSSDMYRREYNEVIYKTGMDEK